MEYWETGDIYTTLILQMDYEETEGKQKGTTWYWCNHFGYTRHTEIEGVVYLKCIEWNCHATAKLSMGKVTVTRQHTCTPCPDKLVNLKSVKKMQWQSEYQKPEIQKHLETGLLLVWFLNGPTIQKELCRDDIENISNVWKLDLSSDAIWIQEWFSNGLCNWTF